MVKTIEDPQNARSRRTSAGLLTAARELLEEQGFDALTMAAVADRAGVSRRAVYLHFASRAELLSRLFSYVGRSEELTDSLERVWVAPDAVTALDEWARHVGRCHPRILAVSRAIDRVRGSDPDAAALWDAAMDNWYAGCGRVVGDLEKEGRLAAPWTAETATDALWGLMSFELLERLIVDRGWTQAQYTEHLALLFHRTFVAPGPEQAEAPAEDRDRRRERERPATGPS
ncbi:TetR/AcrR family transcriptional regulator [Streptomyces sp. NPDC047928]|uniref:TetR/AcrR family transcriptional regulator n=1 Tax=unclassified Streptomyces TaxID=2593676 RepID=UPI00371254AF